MPQEKKKASVTRQSAKASPLKPEPEIELPKPREHSTGFWWLLAAGIVLLGGSMVFALSGNMPGWESRIFTTINSMQAPEFVTHLAKALSNAVWGAVALVGVCLLIPKLRFRAWQYAVAGVCSYAAVFILEHIVSRARPEFLLNNAIVRAVQDGPGFPSGHVATLAAICLTVWIFVSWPWRIFIVLLLIAEAWARLFLGLHAPLDTVGGVGVAMIVVSILHLLPQKVRSTFRLM